MGAFPAAALQTSRPASTSVLPLVLTGKQVPGLQGASQAQLTILACPAGKLRPIPFQLDEINKDGRVVSRFGEAKVAPDDTPGIIDENDEIIVMLRDLDGACDAEQVSKLRGSLSTVEVQAPYLKTPAILYILVGDKGYAPETSYIHFDGNTQTIKSSGYLWGYSLPRPYFYDRFGFGDFKGKEFEDVFDRVKIRFRAKALRSLIQLHVSEDDFEGTLDGVRAGPIRVVREVAVKVRILPGFTIPAYASFIHYDRYRDAIIRVQMPAPAALFTSSLDVTFLHDFTGLQGMTISTQNSPEGALVDGEMIEQEKNIRLGDKPWQFLSGQGVNEVMIVRHDEKLQLQGSMYFIDSADVADAPEEFRGGLPSVGFQFLNWQNLKAGSYTIKIAHCAVPSFPEGGGNGFYDVFSNPPQIKVTERSAQPM